jgi:sugar lactone lactonase YvrE
MLWLVALFIVLQTGIFSKKVKLEDILLRAYLFVFIIFILQGKMIEEGFQPTSTYVVTTLAGSTQGFLDATGLSAQFWVPAGVAVDASGNVIVADLHNQRIRKVTPGGVVTTLAGQSTPGFLDATGLSAQFYYPIGVAVDASGNMIVADQHNHRIRKVTPGGVVTTLAGSTAGFSDATGLSAQFYYPIGVAVDASGNVIVADAGNNRIRKVTPGGVVTTLAGSGTRGFLDATGLSAQFAGPTRVAVDASGNVIVADYGNHRIRKVTPGGVVTTLAGSGTRGFLDATGLSAQFDNPSGVAVDVNGNVIVTDYGNHRIRKVTPGGVVTTLAGSTQGFLDATGLSAQFNYPSDVAVDASGNVIVADYKNHRIRVVTPMPAPPVTPMPAPPVTPMPAPPVTPMPAPPVTPVAIPLTISSTGSSTNSLSPTSIGLIVGGSLITLSIILYFISNSRRNTIFD